MSLSLWDAAKTTCALSDWRLTNLQLQKILYIAHLVHVGRTGGLPLINADFEAWDYGPVVPELYQKVKMFGRGPIRDVFYSAQILPDNESGAPIHEACRHLLSKSASQLIAMTHRPNGAWAKHYQAGATGRKIPISDILEEYRTKIK